MSKPQVTGYCRLQTAGFVLCLLLAGLNLENIFVFAQEEDLSKQAEMFRPEESAQPSKELMFKGQYSATEPMPDVEELKGVKGTGERISLDLKGIDIIELLRIFSLKTGLTIVPSSAVRGRVNIFLNNLTFEDALDVILISQNLACERKGNILNIMTASEYKRSYGKEYNEKRSFKKFRLNYATPSTLFKMLSQIKSDIGKIIVDEVSGMVLLIDIPEKLELMEKMAKDLDQPLQTEVFDLNYAKSGNLKAHLSNVITSGPGEVFVDEATSKVMVSDLPGKMNKIRRLIREFDDEIREVFIEAEILQIVLKKEFQRGINWERIFQESRLDGLRYVGTFPVTPSFSPTPDLSTANIKMEIGTLSKDNYTATLRLLESFGDTKILSRPKIAVINNEEARIMVGAREAYITQTLSQAESTTVTSEAVEFIDVGVKLNVTPRINKEGFIMLKIKPEVSSVRETITTSIGSRIPIVETSEAETTVKVKDGSMIMIAGLMREEKRNDTTGIPVLSRIPFLKTFFGSRARLKKNTEIIIFIKPRIISGGGTAEDIKLEKFIPPDMVPKDMLKSIISRKIEEIKVEPQGLLPEQEILKVKQRSQEEEKAAVYIPEKMKGIKEY